MVCLIAPIKHGLGGYAGRVVDLILVVPIKMLMLMAIKTRLQKNPPIPACRIILMPIVKARHGILVWGMTLEISKPILPIYTLKQIICATAMIYFYKPTVTLSPILLNYMRLMLISIQRALTKPARTTAAMLSSPEFRLGIKIGYCRCLGL